MKTKCKDCNKIVSTKKKGKEVLEDMLNHDCEQQIEKNEKK